MDMKVDSSYIKRERERRAWSQEHLAEVTGLGLRTIQRIEKTGAASYESARSLAAVFGVDVADLRVEASVPAPSRRLIPLRPLLGVLAAFVTGGALLVATTSFADQVLMDVGVRLNTTEPGSAAVDTREWFTQMVVDDGTLVPDVNDLQLGSLRFSILPRVQPDGRILLEVGVFERLGNEEIVLGRPRLIALNGEEAGFVIETDDARSLRVSIKAQVNPPGLPPTLRAR